MQPLNKLIATEGIRSRAPFQQHAVKQNVLAGKIQPWQYVVIFLFACGVVIARRPDAIFHAQFFAEDGTVWFADAYNQGWWTAFFIAHAGYYHTFPRLGAAFALLVPFSMAPLALNCIAIGLQAVPVNLMLSTRSAEWGGLRTRVVLAALYLALPNTREINAGITDSQWVLALSAFLLLVASVPRTTAGRMFDLSTLLLCGLTGPFCILLLPIALYLLWRDRNRWRWVQTAALALTCVVQAWALLVKDPSGRHHVAVLGASPEWFIRILAGRIYLGTLLGDNLLAIRPGQHFFVFLVCVALIGTAVLVVCFVTSHAAMKLLLALSSVLLVVSLASPTSQPFVPGVSVWTWMAENGGDRYWFFPTLAFAWSLVWLFGRPEQLLKIIATSLLFLMCMGVVRDWKHPDFYDLQFPRYARSLAIAPKEKVVTIPVNPPGWRMELIKK
jgi:hypothetical protein